MIKKMRGSGIFYSLIFDLLPTMVEDKRVITNSRDKAEAVAKALVKVHSSENLTQEERRGREMTSKVWRSLRPL